MVTIAPLLLAAALSPEPMPGRGAVAIVASARAEVILAERIGPPGEGQRVVRREKREAGAVIFEFE